MNHTEKMEKLRRRIWFAALAVYCTSMLCPTYCTYSELGGESCSEIGGGLAATLFGWLGILASNGGIVLVWFANPLFIIGLIINKKSPTGSLLLSIAASVVSLAFLFGDEIMINEAGHVAKIATLQIGYWLWLTSMILLVLASIYSLGTRSKE
jgi:hypothetical protein